MKNLESAILYEHPVKDFFAEGNLKMHSIPDLKTEKTAFLDFAYTEQGLEMQTTHDMKSSPMVILQGLGKIEVPFRAGLEFVTMELHEWKQITREC